MIGHVSERPQGTVVLLVAGADSESRWTADRAIELCESWSRDGERVVLADLHLEEPLLHAGLDVANMEGVVDIFLYGASIARIAKPVRGGSFYLIPAGTYTPDADEIYNNPRWKKLVAGFRETDATLVLFAPEESADLSALARWAREAVIVGGAGRTLRGKLENAGYTIVGDVADPAFPPVIEEPATTAPPAALPEPETEEEEVFRTLSTRYPAPDEPKVPLHRPPESELELPPPPLRRRSERRTSSMVLWLLFLIILAGAAGYLFATMRPDLLRRILPSEQTGAVATAVEEAPPEVPPEPLGELLPYSVQVKAFTSLAAARDEMEEQQRRLEGVPFFVSPEQIQGILYYRILSGLAADTSAATRLRDRLVADGAIEREDADGALSLVQFTPLAFDLGDFSSPDSAAAAADSLLAMEIPTYTVERDYSDGHARWQLYAGAYPDSASATSLREVLTAAGVDAAFVARSGSPSVLPE